MISPVDISRSNLSLAPSHLSNCLLTLSTWIAPWPLELDIARLTSWSSLQSPSNSILLILFTSVNGNSILLAAPSQILWVLTFITSKAPRLQIPDNTLHPVFSVIGTLHPQPLLCANQQPCSLLNPNHEHILLTHLLIYSKAWSYFFIASTASS